MTDYMTAPISEVVKAILEDGVVDAAEVAQLEKRLYADSTIDKEEAEALFDINNGVSGKTNDDGWKKLFAKAICDYLLNDEASPGVVDEAEAAWLITQLEGDGTIDDTEKFLLKSLKEKAKKLPTSLCEKLKGWGV